MGGQKENGFLNKIGFYPPINSNIDNEKEPSMKILCPETDSTISLDVSDLEDVLPQLKATNHLNPFIDKEITECIQTLIIILSLIFRYNVTKTLRVIF